MSSKIQSFTRSLTLQPAVATPVVIDLDPSAYGGPLGFYLTLHDTGANAIGTILWERSALGDEYVTDAGYATAVGTSLAAGVALSLDDGGITSRFLRITLTSTSGTTCEIRVRASQS